MRIPNSNSSSFNPGTETAAVGATFRAEMGQRGYTTVFGTASLPTATIQVQSSYQQQKSRYSQSANSNNPGTVSLPTTTI